MGDKHRSDRVYRAYCPYCTAEVSERRPWQAKRSMLMVCDKCGGEFRVTIAHLDPPRKKG